MTTSRTRLRFDRTALLLLLLLLLTTLSCAANSSLQHRKLVRALDKTLKLNEQYIVVFDRSKNVHVPEKAAEMTRNVPNARVKFVYEEDSFQAVSLESIPLWQLNHFLDDPDVLYVEEDQIVRAYQDDDVVEQSNPTWGLDRLDEVGLPLDNTYRYKYTGAGVAAFVVDTGIADHIDFEMRPQCGYSSYRSCEDQQGHGTHVAGTIASPTYGVAKGTTLYAVRVLDSRGEGSTSGVLAGIDYIRRAKVNNPNIPMVANLSLGGFYSRSLNEAVEDAVAAGVFFAVAAGNSASNACWESPASADTAVTVAATNNRDRETDFSNYGSCVDIFAPGESITSLWINDQTVTISGTSMSSPHVAGVAALYLEAHPDWTPAQVWQAMKNNAVVDQLRAVSRNTPNLLLNVRNIDGDDEEFVEEDPPVSAPVAAPTPDVGSSCEALFDGCDNSAECCSNACTWGICWIW